MNRLFSASMILVFAFAAIACSRPEQPATPKMWYEGLWLDQGEATELRTTGKLQSRCAEVKKHGSPATNTRLIDREGNVFAYNPNLQTQSKIQMGKVNARGQMKLDGASKLEGLEGVRSVRVDKLREEILKVSYEGDKGSLGSAQYVRTTEAEIQQYFAAQQACLK